MRKKIIVFLKLFLSCSFLFGVIVWGTHIEEVYAASSELITNDYTISVGDRVYLPSLAKLGQNAKFMILKDVFNPYSGKYEEVFTSSDIITGKKKGEGRIWTLDNSGNICDGMVLHVTDRPTFSLGGTTSIGMQIGQVGRSFVIRPTESNTYRFSVSGANYSETWVYSQNYGSVIGQAAGSGANLEVYLEANRIYYLEFYTYNTSSSDISAPNHAVTLNVTVTENAKASNIDLHANAYAFKIENNTYYMLEGDSFDLKIVQSGVPNFQKVKYQVNSTNSGVASVVYYLDKDTGIVRCGAAGTANISVTTTNMLTDTITVVVLSSSQIVAGDMDMDGTLTKADIVNLYLAMTGKIEKTRIYYHADVNHDGNVTDADVMALWDRIGGLPFVDVAENDWFYNAVKTNYDENIMTGMNSIQFGPYESLSRAQFALILYRMQNSPEVKNSNPFDDISGDEWYANAVLWAYEKGIVTGFGDHTFRPADLITREQMVSMMYRYAIYLQEDISNKVDYDQFADADSVSEYARESMEWAVGTGIITGKISEKGVVLAPWGATARAEAAIIIERFLGITNSIVI